MLDTGSASCAHPSPRRLPLLLALFAASGCAALIYEIVWFQMLELVIGSTAISLAVLLGTYMGGMGLGSLLLPRLVPAGRHPLRVYAGLELIIGAMGVVLLAGMPLIGRLYAVGAGAGLPLRNLPAYSDHGHGRHPASRLALDRDDAAGRVLDGLSLRVQYSGRGRRLPAGGVLSAENS